MSELIKNEHFNFSLSNSSNINLKAVEKIEKYLPEILEKTKFFDRKNSQSSLTLMSLTMLNGQCPYRLLRQVLAEIERRKEALIGSQIVHAQLVRDIEKNADVTESVKLAKQRQRTENLPVLESKINGTIKDIAVLIDQYNRIKEKNNIDEWYEVAFEKSEKRFHCRRGFELMYRNLVVGTRPAESTMEYLQQYGVHPQICIAECSGYINYTNQRIKNNEMLHSNDLEDFLDHMADKYQDNVDLTCERMFGEKDVLNYDYMYKNVRS